MKQNSAFLKTISVILIFLLFTTNFTLLAQVANNDEISEFEQGKIDGDNDAAGNALWILAGAGCGILGAGAAYFSKPDPPTEKILGKSGDYVLGYTEGYQKSASATNLAYACGGWAGFLVIFAAAGGFSAE